MLPISESWPPDIRGRCNAINGLLQQRYWAAARVQCEPCLRGLPLTDEQREWFRRADHVAEAGMLVDQTREDLRAKRTETSIRIALDRLARALELDPSNDEAQRLKLQLDVEIEKLEIEQKLLPRINEDLRWVLDPEKPRKDRDQLVRRLFAIHENAKRVKALDPTINLAGILGRAEQVAALYGLSFPPDLPREPVVDPAAIDAMRRRLEAWERRGRFSSVAAGTDLEAQRQRVVDWIHRWLDEPRPGETEPPAEHEALAGRWRQVVDARAEELLRGLRAHAEIAGEDPEIGALERRIAESRAGEGPEELTTLETAVSTLRARPTASEARLRGAIEGGRALLERRRPRELERDFDALGEALRLADRALDASEAAEFAALDRLLRERAGRAETRLTHWLGEQRQELSRLHGRIEELRRSVQDGAARRQLESAISRLASLDPALDPEAFAAGFVQSRADYEAVIEKERREGEALRERRHRIRRRLSPLLEEFVAVGALAAQDEAGWKKTAARLEDAAPALSAAELDAVEAQIDALEQAYRRELGQCQGEWEALTPKAEALLARGGQEIPPELRKRLAGAAKPPASDTLAEWRRAKTDLAELLAEVDGAIREWSALLVEERSELEQSRAALDDPFLESSVEPLAAAGGRGETAELLSAAARTASAAAEARRALEAAVASFDRSGLATLRVSVSRLRSATADALQRATASREAQTRLRDKLGPLRAEIEKRHRALTEDGDPADDARGELEAVRQRLGRRGEGSPAAVRAAVFEELNDLAGLERIQEARVERARRMRGEAERRLRGWKAPGRVRFPPVPGGVRAQWHEARRALEEALGPDATPARIEAACRLYDQTGSRIGRNWLPYLAGAAVIGLGSLVTYGVFVPRTVELPHVVGYELVGVYEGGAAAGGTSLAGDDRRVSLRFVDGSRYRAVWGRGDADTDHVTADFSLLPWPFPAPEVRPQGAKGHLRLMDEHLSRQPWFHD